MLVGAEGDDDRIITLRFPEPDLSVSDTLMQIKDIGFSYGDKVLWENVDLNIGRTSRIAIMGRNGLGKSTLLQCIAGKETPQRGKTIRHHNLRTAVFTQHLVQDIDLTKSPVQLMMDKFPRIEDAGY